jgi:hypothetical protein
VLTLWARASVFTAPRLRSYSTIRIPRLDGPDLQKRLSAPRLILPSSTDKDSVTVVDRVRQIVATIDWATIRLIFV